MKLSRSITPWARQRLNGADRLLIDLAEPRDAEVVFGYSRGWTCRIVAGRRVIGEAYEFATPRGALKAAQDDMASRKAAA
jgi:hypothetical protein